MTTHSVHGRRARRALMLAAGTVLLAGCLGEPKLEDRWTRIDIVGSNVTPYQALPSGSTQSFSVQTKITYRKILTGFAVGELRASGSLTPASVALNPEAPRLQMAHDIDRILANSVSVGRATRAVTGWDHLIQPIDFTFNAGTPGSVDSTGAQANFFLIVYLGSGERVELQGGGDSIIVTPFQSDAYEILPVGMEFAPVGGTP
jgi:hypothetical protein